MAREGRNTGREKNPCRYVDIGTAITVSMPTPRTLTRVSQVCRMLTVAAIRPSARRRWRKPSKRDFPNSAQ